MSQAIASASPPAMVPASVQTAASEELGRILTERQRSDEFFEVLMQLHQIHVRQVADLVSEVTQLHGQQNQPWQGCTRGDDQPASPLEDFIDKMNVGELDFSRLLPVSSSSQSVVHKPPRLSPTLWTRVGKRQCSRALF